MKILYLGEKSGTSKYRADALGRIGHEVTIITPEQFVPKGRLVSKFHYETGGIFAQKAVGQQILAEIKNQQFDLTWVDKGRFVGRELIQALQKQHGPVVNYNVDNPFHYRDGFSWQTFKNAVPFYDLLAVVRETNIDEAKRAGAKAVIRVVQSADEVANKPREFDDATKAKWATEVVFVGTNFEDRGTFMVKLLDLGVPLSIYGNGWQKTKQWPRLQNAWKGPGTTTDTDYAAAIQNAKICLCLLSKGNQDVHTTRSLEIPALGSVLCAPRTDEHLSLYKDGEEAVFWSSAEECAEVCNRLLNDKALRDSIAKKGHERCIANGHYNEQVAQRILKELMKGGSNE